MYRSADFRQLLERNALLVIEMSASSFLSIRWENELAEVDRIAAYRNGSLRRALVLEFRDSFDRGL